MFIQDSRRSYRTYRYSELILKTDLCLFRTPVGATELILKLRSLYLFGDTRRYHRDYETYTGIAELILVLQILYGAYSGTKVPVGTTQIHYTKVPVGTTGFILIVRIREYS